MSYTEIIAYVGEVIVVFIAFIDFSTYFSKEKLKKKYTLGDFFRGDLIKLLENVFKLKDDEYINNIIKFHEERNLIIYKKKRKIHPDIIKFRSSVIDLIKRLENFIYDN